MFSAAFVYFFWALAVYMRDRESDEGRRAGRAHVVYGILGMVIMVSVYGILNVVLGTFGITTPSCPLFMQPFKDIDKIDVKTSL
jgi:hypothetical protein